MVISAIPDAIDYQKYYDIYDSNKKVSDDKRGHAENLRSIAKSTDRQIANIENDISRWRREIKNHHIQLEDEANEKARLIAEIPQLQSTIAMRRRQISNQEIEISNLESDVSNLLSQIRRLDSKIDNAELDARASESRIASHNTKISSENERLRQKRSELTRLEGEIQQLKNEIRDLNKNIRLLETEIPQLERRVSSINSTLSDLGRQRTTLTQNIQTKTNELSPLNTQLRNIKSKISAITGQIRTKNSELSTLRNQVSSYQSQIDSEERKLAQLIKQNQQTPTPELKAKIMASRRNLMRLRGLKSGVESQVFSVQSDINSLQSQQLSLQGDENRIQSQISNIESDIRSYKTQLSQVNTQINTNNSLKQKAERALSQAEDDLPRMRNLLAACHRALRSKESLRPGVQSSIDTLIASVHQTESLKRSEEQVLARIRANIVDLSSQMSSLKSEKSLTERRISQLRTSNETLDDLNDQDTSTISWNRRRIEKIKSTKVTLENAIVTKTASIKNGVNSLPPLRTRSAQEWRSFQGADSIAVAKEKITSESLSKYRSVKAHYDNLLASANSSGRQQGQANGTNSGLLVGEQNGGKQGRLEGLEDGKLDAKEWGYLQGLRTGETDGEKQGYQHGLNAPENYDEGHVAGVEQGEKNAWVYAKANEFPRGRADMRAELLSKAPATKVTLDNVVQELAAFFGAPRMLSMESSAVSAGGTKSKASSFPLSKVPYTKPSNVVVEMDKIDLNEANCQLSYVDFTNACQRSYERSYESYYGGNYKTSYLKKHESSFRGAYVENWEVHKMDRYQEGYDKTYPILFAKWDAIGAQEAKDSGYADGLSKGYADILAHAKQTEYEKGEVAEEQFFAQNSVVKAHSVKAVSKDTLATVSVVKAGDKFPIQTRLINFGKVDAKAKDYKIKFVSKSKHLFFDKNLIELRDLPASTQVDLNTLNSINLGPNLGADARLSYDVQLIDDNGIVNTVSQQLDSKLHILLETTVDIELEPRIMKGLFGWYSTDIKVKVNNSTSNAAESEFEARLIVPKFSGLRIKEDYDVIKALRPGRSDSVKFEYQMRDRSLAGKEIPMTIEILYDGSVSYRKTFTVVPWTN